MVVLVEETSIKQAREQNMRKSTQPELFGVIHLGSEQSGIQVVEYQGLHDIKVIEKAFRAVTLGEETFKTGKISYASLSGICDLLKGYRRLFTEYGVRDYRLVATTAIREALNQRYIIDQIKVKTGFQVEVIDMPKEIFYKYCGLFKFMDDHKLTNHNGVNLFVDISSGGLGFTLYQDRQILYQQNIHIGALRIKESFQKNQRESIHFHQALSELISSTIEPVKAAVSKHKIQHLVLSGNETDLVLTMMGKKAEGELLLIEPSDFTALYNQLPLLNIPYLMQAYNLPEARAEIVLPTLMLYQEILTLAEVGKIVIPQISFVDGVTIHHVAEKTQDPFMAAMDEQIVSLAYALARKYAFDVHHAQAVSDRSLLLFDHLTKVHGLGKRERFLLKIAGILHDVGKYINLRSHYLYSYRLIMSSDIFGFSAQEKHVIANLAYYHSKGTPDEGDSHFQLLTEEQKIVISKLVAIIRLADALDRSHRQKLRDLSVKLKGDEIVIAYDSAEDTSLEEWTFIDQADFFQEVFGIRVILHRRGR